MISRTIQRRRRGRKAITALAAVGLIAGSLYFSGIALAVHDTGAFQLDGDAQQATSPATAVGTIAPNGDDWDNICASNPLTCTFQSGFTASASTTASASAHDSDSAVISGICSGGTNCTVFTGGGSKDPNDLSSWNWKTDTGGLPAKDNLAHSFAARYALPSTGTGDTTCPSTTAGTDACKLLYFGSDRIDNSGDAQEGFWFFQNPVCIKTDGTFGNSGSNGASCSGTAAHAVGDLLILSDFSVGGTTSTINIYKWVASGGDVSTHLLSLGGSTTAACNKTPPLPTNDAFCGLVNGTNGTKAPWTFTDKSGNSTYLQGELYEGGVNLSAPSVNLGGECFASFVSETRSSTSPSATLKDFVIGSFASCTSGTVTTPQTSTGGALDSGANAASIGTGVIQVQDLATVTGTGSSTKPTGTVKFYICGPAASDAAAQCDSTAAGPSNGFHFGTDKTLAPDGANKATATSSLVTLTEVGHYCFRADYSGDGLFPPSSDNSLGECFAVTPVSASLSTLASGGGQIPATISDTATLSGAATGPGSGGIGSDGSINPTTNGTVGGSISWTAYGPNNCTTVAMATTSRDVTNGNGTYPQGAQAAVSFSATAVGTYTFVASYATGSVNTVGVQASACPDTTGTEAVTTTDSSSVLTDQTWVPNDHAQITSTGGSALNGNAVFTLYDNGTCNGNVIYTNGPTGAAVSGTSPQVVASNNTTAVNASTTVSWLVVYTSKNGTTGSTSSCESTTLTITNNPGYLPLP